MKKLLFATLACLLLQCAVNPSYAGFIIRKHSLVTSPAASRAGEQTLTSNDNIPGGDNRYDGNTRKHKPPQSTSGWEGIVSFICAVTFWLSIPAIVFGAIGMKRGKRHHDLAVAGFVLGIVEAALFLFAIFVLLAIYVW